MRYSWKRLRGNRLGGMAFRTANLFAALCLLGTLGCGGDTPGGTEGSPKTSGGENEGSGAHATGGEAELPALPVPSNPAEAVMADLIIGFQDLRELLDEISDAESASRNVPKIEYTAIGIQEKLNEAETFADSEKAKSAEIFADRLAAETAKFQLSLGRIMQVPGAGPPVLVALGPLSPAASRPETH